MRGGIKVMKKLFLMFLLFMPPLCYADGGIVIGSSNQLTEKILPLDYDLMEDAYKNTIFTNDCTNNRSLYEAFFEGEVNIPFSGQDLLRLCKSITRGRDFVDNSYCRNKICPHFVLNYMQAIAQKNNASTEFVPFNYDYLLAAFRAVGRSVDNPEYGADCLYNNYLNGQITDSVSTKALRDQCVNCLYRPNVDVTAFWESRGCAEFVIEYKNFFKYLTDY